MTMLPRASPARSSGFLPFRNKSYREALTRSPTASEETELYGTSVAGLPAEGPRVLRPVRGGRREHPESGRAARADAAGLPREERARARDPDLRAARGPHHT